ncbi:transmembrane protein 134 [Lepisosteus oculatus]|uniref:transmembrane protein 134 n=1 Tax=Lepisosteus oculatus TaxID=7918 RepID=UPI003715E45F
MATQFNIDDAFSLDGDEEAEVGREGAEGGSRFGTLSFTRQSANTGPAKTANTTIGVSSSAQADQSSLKYQNLQNDEDGLSSGGHAFNSFFKIRDPSSLSTRSSQWSFSTLSSSTQRSYRECFSWTRHPLILKNRRVVCASFLLLFTGLALILAGIAVQMNPAAGVSSAIFFVPGFLLFIPGVYHVIFIYCAVQGKRGFRFFYLPYFEK